MATKGPGGCCEHPRVVADYAGVDVHQSTLARLVGKIEVQPNGCWHLAGVRDRRDGYGDLWVDGKHELAHRVIFQLFVGPIPDGLWVDHQCHNVDLRCAGGSSCLHRRCVNPAHLEAVTPRVNTLRGRAPSALNAVKSRCPAGHPYDVANTYVDPDGGRECRTCRKARADEWLRVHHPGVRHGTETHCPQGHPYSGANLYIIPSSGGRMCRTCKRTQSTESARRRRQAQREAR